MMEKDSLEPIFPLSLLSVKATQLYFSAWGLNDQRNEIFLKQAIHTIQLGLSKVAKWPIRVTDVGSID